MGADGGVVYVPLRVRNKRNYERAVELLRPFWQFLSRSGGADWAETANHAWEEAHPEIGPPNYLLGYYGTDRCDNYTLGSLPRLCEPFGDWRGDLYALTLDEFDLNYRTSPVPVKGDYYEHPLLRLWHSHFEYQSREAVLLALGALATMTFRQWADELDELLRFDCVMHEETWT